MSLPTATTATTAPTAPIVANNHMTTIVTKTGRHTISTALLVNHSPYFAKMLATTHPWKESQTSTVHLPEADKDAVHIYLVYLTTGKIAQNQILGLAALRDSSILVGNKHTIGKERVNMAKLDLLIETYLLADYLLAPLEFRDIVMSYILDNYNTITTASSTGSIPLSHLATVYAKTLPPTPLCNLIIDILSSCLSKETLDQAVMLELISLEMFEAVKENLEKYAAEGTIMEKPWAKYHPRYFVHGREKVLPFWDIEGLEVEGQAGDENGNGGIW